MKTRRLNHRHVIMLPLIWSLSLVLLLVSAVAVATTSVTTSVTTLTELEQADNIRIKSWIEPADNIVSRQQVMLQIEVATDKGFSDGTRIGNFEIKDAITMQREKFALNSIRSDGDKTWTVQQWTLVIYPQRSGLFEIPPIPLALSIVGENSEVITGNTHTQAMTFSAETPKELMDKQEWVATTDFEVNDRFNKSLEGLKAGDALIRTISMSASNLPAMMLPKVLTNDITGIATYAKPPVLTDKVNRGDYLAERTQNITYVFEQAGEFELPEISLHWWNLETQSAETVTLSAQTIMIASLPGVSSGQGNTTEFDLSGIVKNNLPMIIKTGLVIVLLFTTLWLGHRWFSKFKSKDASTTKPPSRSKLLKLAKKSCQQNNQEQALNYLYQWLAYRRINNIDNESGAMSEWVDELNNNELRQAYDKMMQAVYSREQSQSAITCRFINQFTTELIKQDRPSYTFQSTIEMKLN